MKRNSKMNNSLWKSMIKVFIVIILFGVLSNDTSFAQGKQANIWYFGNKAGIDFNMGSPPIALTNSQMLIPPGPISGSASISDTNGHILFYSDGINIWNQNHEYMLNGENLGCNSTQGAMIVPKPGNDQLYYLFGFDYNQTTTIPYLIYSIVDMNLDGGLGGVIADKKSLPLMANTTLHLSAVKNATTDNIWVLAHGYESNKYYAFLISGDSLDTTPIVSYAGSDLLNDIGYMKISPDGEKVAVAVYTGTNSLFEVLDFNSTTGIVSDENLVHKSGSCIAVEFSPDNTKFYAVRSLIYQYNLEVGSPQQILDSEVLIPSTPDVYSALQIGPDGKIYRADGSSDYLSVIHEPNKLGLACNYEEGAVDLAGRRCSGGLPSFIQSYLNDPVFETDNNCLASATQFSIQETNGIDSVFWKFNDLPNMPNDTSTLFSPAYVFSHEGTFNVSLTVYSGLLVKTVEQQVVILPLPQPNLGPDTSFCDTVFSITLNANCEGDEFYWNIFGVTVPEVTVSETGLYWVKVIKDGCSNRDSIHIGLFEKPLLDTVNLLVTPAGCGLANGSISGLLVSGADPLAYYWLDTNNDTIGFDLDIANLAPGIYSLLVADGNGCSNLLASYLVLDDGNLAIDSVHFTEDHCSQGLASIQIYCPPTGSEISYSIDGGVNYFQNAGLFSGLPAGEYQIMAKDENDCQGIFTHNPVTINNIGNPQVASVFVQDENAYNADGQIEIEAFAGEGDIFYSIDNGLNFQSDNGLFTGLSADTFHCVVKDAFACDTIFDVIVKRVFSTPLEAIAGDGNTCMGNVVASPLLLNHFTQVKSFSLKLNFDKDLIRCEGYIHLANELEDGFSANILPGLGEIELSWQGQSPLDLPEKTTLAELVFSPILDGYSPVSWVTTTGGSVFLDQYNQPINVDFLSGNIEIYAKPKIQTLADLSFCQGDSLLVSAHAQGGNGALQFTWAGPDGFVSGDSTLVQNNIQLAQAGLYKVQVSDSLGCEDRDSLLVLVNPSPVISFAGADTLYMQSGEALHAGQGYPDYLWNTGAQTEYILIDSTGGYFVVVTSDKGCLSSETVQILWSGQDFYLPNAFTPNGDGLNDVFAPLPRADYFGEYHLSIHNRWGQLLFESSSPDKGWDGRFKGQLAMEGVYIYRIVYNAKRNSTENKVVRGTVVLLR
jgi:gliding motility-associated-like protein